MRAIGAYASIVPLLFFLLSFNAQSQTVSGTVFKDFNMDGAKGTASPNLDVGMAGVIVKATKPDGTTLSVTYTGSGTATNSTGAYTVTGGTLGQIRLEFVMPDNYTFASNGASGGTTVLFPSAATQNLAVNYPADYCGVADPMLVTSCYVGNNAAGVNDVLVKYAYSSTGATHSASHATIALANEIGSTYGIAYDRTTQNIYAGAFLKRHIPLKDNNSDGKEDIGAIYKIPSSGSPSLWLYVTTLGVDVGMASMPTIAARALPIPATTSDLAASHDTQVYPLVGKIGLGDIEISDDNSQLFFVNLFDSKVYTVDLATKTLVGSGVAVPNACTGGIARPFALAYHRGKLYVGVVCDASTSMLAADMKATVYSFDGTTFTSVLSYPLNYTKGAAFTWGGIYGNKWNPWEDSFSNISGGISPTNLNLVCEPQPIFADIVFDTDESLIMVLNDRLGHQTGTANYQPSTTDTKLYYGLAGGDILRASLVSGVYTLEKNGSSGGVTTAGAGNSQGPGTPTGTGYTSPSGEFYVGDDENSVHEEVVGGGAAILPGRGQVVTQVSDPAQNYFAGGTYWFNNTTGEYDKFYVVFVDPTSGQQPWLFGKANGLGDMEVLCNNAPIEIGNRVWYDTDADGVQDAGEAGISGVTVTLYASNGTTVISTATTDASGNYFFSSATGTSTTSAKYGLALSFKTNYVLSFPTTSGTKSLTVSDTGGNDVLDSDADAAGKVAFVTGNAGENNHSFDVGYATVAVCTKPNAGTDAAAVCQPATTAKLTAVTAGGTWAPIGTPANPATATIDAAGNIAGMTATGTYKFVYSVTGGGITCTDTAQVTVNPKPNAGTDQSICAPTATATLAATPTGGTWTAQGNNPAVATVSNVGAVAGMSAVGNYKFIYTLNGCADTVMVTVKTKPSAGPDQTLACANPATNTLTTATTLVPSPAGGTWAQQGTTPATATITGNNVTNMTVAGIYQFIYTLNGCTDTVAVTVSPCAGCVKPNAGPDAANVCQPTSTAKLTAVTTGGTWAPIGSPANPATATIDANGNIAGMIAAGIYKFVYSVTGGGITCTDTAQVTVNPKPNAGTDQSVCAPTATATLSATPAGGTWAVQTGNPATATVSNAGAVSGMSAVGNYKFIYTLNGCADTVMVTVKAKPSAGPDQTLACANPATNTLTTTTTLVPSPAGGTWTQQGTTPATATITGNNVTNMTVAGTYQFIYTLNGCTDTVAVTVSPCAGCVKPNAGPDAANVCQPTSTAKLTAVTTGGTWAPIGTPANPATATIDANGNIAGMTAAGIYKFVYSVTGGGITCTDTAQVTVNAKPNAGTDKSLSCTGTAITTNTTLSGFSPSGGAWSALSGNPATATITNTGVVQNMTIAGTYKFIYTTNGNCTDTVAVTVESCACNTTCYRTLGNATNCDGSTNGAGISYFSSGSVLNKLYIQNVTLKECSVDGTASIVGLLTQNADGTGEQFTINFNYSGYSTTNPGPEPFHENECSPVTDFTDWHWYSTVSGTITSSVTGVYTITRYGPATQIGTKAGEKFLGYGIGGWYEHSQGFHTGYFDFWAPVSELQCPCTKPNAGPDAANVCQPTKTAKLTAVTTGGTWAPIGTPANPAIATIDANGNIAGMTAAGTYKFVYSVTGGGITCTDTAQVTVNAKPNAGKDTTMACVNAANNTLATAITLAPTPTGGTWAQIGTTPVTATINGNAVTNMTVAGTYQFVYTTTAGCKDTIAVTVSPCTGCVKPNAGPDKTLICTAGVAPSTTILTATPTGGTWIPQTGNPVNATVTNAGAVSGMTSPGNYKFIYSVTGGGLTCSDTVVVIVPNCNCNPPVPTLLTPSNTVCLGDTFSTIKATVVGLATVEWFATPTGGSPIFTGLNFKPAGMVTKDTVFYAQARSIDPTCPAAISSTRVSATITAKNCTVEVDLALKKSINKKIAQIGDELVYTVKVFNQLNTAATGVEVTDSIATTVQFVAGSFVASRGSAVISGNVIKWNIGNINASPDTVTLTYKVKAIAEGIHFNTAQICKTNEKDVDSTPCNNKDDEDDIDRQCFTVPFKLCPNEKIEASVPAQYTGVKWFKGGMEVTALAGQNVVLLSEVGSYTYTATNQTCPASGCCPIIIEPGDNCCTAGLCIPFTIKKMKKK